MDAVTFRLWVEALEEKVCAAVILDGYDVDLSVVDGMADIRGVFVGVREVVCVVRSKVDVEVVVGQLSTWCDMLAAHE